MPRKPKPISLTQPVKDPSQFIKVRLDHRTIITLASTKPLAFWRKRYPNLTIITQPE